MERSFLRGRCHTAHFASFDCVDGTYWFSCSRCCFVVARKLRDKVTLVAASRSRRAASGRVLWRTGALACPTERSSPCAVSERAGAPPARVFGDVASGGALASLANHRLLPGTPPACCCASEASGLLCERG